jgi:hypothetical protein
MITGGDKNNYRSSIKLGSILLRRFFYENGKVETEEAAVIFTDISCPPA